MYDPRVGQWLSPDPIGFLGGDTNLRAYVGNSPTNFVDPTGLSREWAWHWHHLLDQAIFTPEFLAKHKLSMDIHSEKYGWMLRAKDHTDMGGIHPEGWSDDWKDWIKNQSRKGITEDSIDKQLQRMIEKYKLCEKGFPAEFSYDMAKQAYEAAERMFRSKAATEALKKLGKKTVNELLDDAADGKQVGKSKKIGKKIGGGLVGFLIGLGVNWASGSDDVLGDTLDPLEPSNMGNAELSPNWGDPGIVEQWQAHQDELDRRAAEAGMNVGVLDLSVLHGQGLGRTPTQTPSGTPSRLPLMPNRPYPR